MWRRDRKRVIASTVAGYISEYVHDVAKFAGLSDGEAGARIVLAALGDVSTVGRLAPYFARDYAMRDMAWIGHRRRDSLDRLIACDDGERLYMRFAADDWDAIDALGFVLGRNPAHAAAALLRLAHDYPRVTQIAAPGWTPKNPFSIRTVGSHGMA